MSAAPTRADTSVVRHIAPLLPLVTLALSACPHVPPPPPPDVPAERPRAPVGDDDDDDDDDDLPVPPAPVVEPACAPYEDDLRALADEFAAVLEGEQVPGGVFGVVVGDCFFTYGVGLDREGALIDGRTRFQMASVSKLFAAVTVNALAEDGLLDKHAPVSSIVAVNDRAPYDAEGFAPFTTDQLLAHRSGFADWFLSDDGSVLERAAFFGAHASEPLWYPPDEAYIYNNIGYALAGYVAESAGGAPYATLVQQRVLDPLGMADTRLGSTLDPDEPRSAAGASGAPGAVTLFGSDDAFFRSEIYEPMGGVWSSARDMLTLGKAIVDHDARLMSPASIDDLAVSRGPSTGSVSDYGQGLLIYGDVWMHDGATSGFLTELTMVPSRGVVFAAMVSADWYFPYEFAFGAVDRFAPGIDYGPFPTSTPAADWAGTYVDDVIVGRVVIEAVGDDLRLSFPDVDLGPTVPTTTTAALVYDDMYTCAFFDWGEGELVMQRGADGSRYAASRNFVARSP